MKKILLAAFLIITLALAACAGQNAAPQSGAVQSTADTGTTADQSSAAADGSTVGLDTTYENALSAAAQLLMGTLKLDGTDQALTTEQAAALQSLWTEYSSLSMSLGGGPNSSNPGGTGADAGSGTSATQLQLTDLLAQIQAAMSAEQVNAIGAMQLTTEDLTAMMDELGISLGRGQMTGQQPGGNPPAGGLGPSGNAGTPPDSGQGAQGANGMGRMGGMLTPEVFNALLTYLSGISGIEVDTAALNPAGLGAQGANAGGLQAPGGSASSTANLLGAYVIDGTSATEDGGTYTSDTEDTSAIYVKNGGSLVLTQSTVTTTGGTSSNDNSSFYGQNAAVLADSGSTISISDSVITTSGSGANGAFASGTGSVVNLTNVTIHATGSGGHGVMATLGGTVNLVNVDLTTEDRNGGVLATDRGSGTITAVGGTVVANGIDSPAIYSTGVITVTDATLTANGAEAAVIEGGNSITLTNSSLKGTFEKWGAMIYQSMSGDAEGTRGVFSMTDGSFEYTPTSGPLFLVTNSTGVITLKNVEIVSQSDILIEAKAFNWGSSGSNGGSVELTADSQSLTGRLIADAISSLDVTLQNGSTLEGAINADNTAKDASLTLDASSQWIVTADSYLTCLDDSAGISGTTISNIIGNGHSVYYASSACPALGGLTYSLAGGGTLEPVQ